MNAAVYLNPSKSFFVQLLYYFELRITTYFLSALGVEILAEIDRRILALNPLSSPFRYPDRPSVFVIAVLTDFRRRLRHLIRSPFLSPSLMLLLPSLAFMRSTSVSGKEGGPTATARAVQFCFYLPNETDLPRNMGNS